VYVTAATDPVKFTFVTFALLTVTPCVDGLYLNPVALGVTA
jgi:hypothetical protein